MPAMLLLAAVNTRGGAVPARLLQMMMVQERAANEVSGRPAATVGALGPSIFCRCARPTLAKKPRIAEGVSCRCRLPLPG